MGASLDALRVAAAEPWLALDTECTGVGPYDAVIEIAVVNAGGAVVLDELVAPCRPVTAKATAVHGLREEDLAEAAPWPRVWERLLPILGTGPVVAWNAAFDLRLIRQTCDRHRMPFATPRLWCLRTAFQERHPLCRSTLEAACLTLGLPCRPAHRALADARVARAVFRELMAPEP
jgi:DNA polymerase-3 subunit epsilon